MDDRPALSLTFGIEMEFIHLQNTMVRRLSQAALPPSCPGRRRITEALSDQLEAKCARCGSLHTLQLPLNNDIWPKNYSKWHIANDNSLHFLPREQSRFDATLETCQMFKMEVISRILDVLPAPGTKDINCETSQAHQLLAEDEIAAVCQRLDEAFNSKDGSRSCRNIVNKTCGLHVHIGNRKKGFPLQTVKNILCLCVAHELQMDQLHSADRITGSKAAFSAKRPAGDEQGDHMLDADSWNMPWSAHFIHAAERQANGQRPFSSIQSPVLSYPASRSNISPEPTKAAAVFSVASWLRIIQEAKTLNDLKALQRGQAHSSTINLQNLFELDADGPRKFHKMTIEFRQHAGTLQADEINAWVAVLVSLVTFAHRTDQAEIHRLCMTNWVSARFGPVDFLKMCGCSRRLQRWYRYKTHYRKDGSTYALDIREKEREGAHAFGTSDFFAPILSYFVAKRTGQMDPGGVLAKIDKKWRNGCYGQYPAEALAPMGLRDSLRRRLTLGWRPSDLEEGEYFSEEDEFTDDEAVFNL